MKKMAKIARGAIAGVLLAVLASVTTGASAQAPSGEPMYRVTIYGWFPGISGETEFPSGAGGPSLNLNAKDVLDNLKMAFMGEFDVRVGKWGGLVDVVYADLGNDKSFTRNLTIHGRPLDAGVTANLSLDAKTIVLGLAGTYAMVESPETILNLVFGARMLKMKQTLDWAFNGTGPIGVGMSGRSVVEETNWDAIVGLGGRARFGSDLRWFIPYYADIGTGNSKLTWQAFVGAGYSFGWGDVIAGWRYLDYDFKSGEPLQSFTFNGVAVGASIKF